MFLLVKAARLVDSGISVCPGDCRKQKCEDKCGINIAVGTNGTN